MLQFFLDEVLKTDDDNVYYLTTPNVSQRENPLRMLVDNPLTNDYFEQFMNRLSPQQRIEQLVFKSYAGTSMLTSSSNKDFRDTLASIMETALNALETPIEDFDTLWALFTFCFGNLTDTKFLDLVLSKAPKATKSKLLCHYECGRSHNAVWKMLDKGNEKEDKAKMEVVLKHVEKSQQLDLLNDKANPDIYHQSALEKVCAKGDNEKFAMIQKMYAEQKDDFEAQLTKFNYKNESLLRKSIAAGMFDHCSTFDGLYLILCCTFCKGDNSVSSDILKAIKSDATKMKILNMRSKVDRTNVFQVARTNGNKTMLKKAVTSVLENIKSNKLKYDAFIPYFQWLIVENDLESIKALFDIFKKDKNSTAKLVNSRMPDRKNMIAASCTSDDKVELLEFLLSYLRDKDLRSMLMHRNESNRTALQAASKKCEALILKHVMIKDKTLLKDLLVEDEYVMLRGHVSDKEELVEIFKYCDGRVLNEEVINRLLTACGWAKTNDEIRALIMEQGGAFGVTVHSMYSHVNPQNGNIPLYECMIQNNEKLFDTILESIDLDDKDNIEYLIAYKNFNDENLLHAACKAPENRLKYCQAVMDLCQFQAERETMLSAKDLTGNNPLQLFLQKVQTYYYGNQGNKNKEDNRMFCCR